MANIKDVARRAGVSISTVSNVLSNERYVSDELKEKILAAVDELGYSPDHIARNMKRKRTHNIGVITANIGGLFYSYVLRGIYDVLTTEGYSVSIADLNIVGNKAQTMAKELEYFKEFSSSKVDGIIFCSSSTNEEMEEISEKFKTIANARKRTALVSIETDFSNYGIDSVCYDNHLGTEKAVNHLVARGCRKIGHIQGPSFSKQARERSEAFYWTMDKAGLAVSDLFVACGNFSFESGYDAMAALWARHPDVDGIFAGNDEMAVGAMNFLLDQGIRIPEDVKVVGYDDVYLSNIIRPSLSTIHVQKTEIGCSAATLLLEKLRREEELPAKRFELETSLVVRETTAF